MGWEYGTGTGTGMDTSDLVTSCQTTKLTGMTGLPAGRQQTITRTDGQTDTDGRTKRCLYELAFITYITSVDWLY